MLGRRPLLWLIAAIVAVSVPLQASAAPIEQVESPIILLRADLPREQTEKLHQQLSRLGERLAKYWGAPLQGQVRCNVVADLKNWPDAFTPDVEQQLKALAGTTITERRSIDGKVVSIQSTVFAVADGRTPQHELTHAFCWQTFGRVGPDWYAEGMAELFADLRRGESGANSPDFVVRYLRSDPASPTPQQIVANDFGDRKPWQVYAHRWALCYLLAHHPAYAERFQAFGREMLRGEQVDFAAGFLANGETLSADYSRFLRSLKQGYTFPATAEQVPGPRKPAP